MRRIPADDARRQVVTFESYHDDEGFDRPGFGEGFFAGERVTAIHVLSRTNEWYQYPETRDAMAAIRAATGGVERLLTYGSSMGGYAAVRFAGIIGAHAALALSPQYSVNLARVRFERRWHQDQRRIRFRRELEQPLATGAQVVCVYDPNEEPDRRHVELIAREVAVVRLPLPDGGHGIGAFLSDIELLRPLVLDMLADRLDAPAFLALAHERRESSPTWLGEHAARVATIDREEALALAEGAAALAPDNPAVLHRLALRLRDLGRYDEAIAQHEHAIFLHDAAIYLWGLSNTLALADRQTEALVVARRLIAHMPQAAGHHRWAARLALATGDRAAALTHLRHAAALFPSNWHYRYGALSLATRLRFARWRHRFQPRSSMEREG